MLPSVLARITRQIIFSFRDVVMWERVYDVVSLTVKAVRELKVQIQSHSAELRGDNCFNGEQ